MFQAVFRHSDVLNLPIVALVLFAFAFVAIALRALRKGDESKEIASLPLAEVEGHLLPYVLPLMAQARALAATLAGKPTPVTYPAMPVVVKTPAWPTVVCPPPAQAQGQWQVTETDEAVEARFLGTGADGNGQLLGFALQGKAVTQRQALAAQVPAILA